MDIKPVTLPDGAWRVLFPRALTLVDEIARHKGDAEPHPSLVAAFEAIAVLDYRPSYGRCVSLADEFLSQL
ncbi:MAG: hypothetical protein ACK4S6_00555 [Roseateles asaccharophilus]|uniref:hypothetical protein n=1 Tax=Roseateles asaccharophilus TaxID=582607 RepID=UPI003918F6E5